MMKSREEVKSRVEMVRAMDTYVSEFGNYKAKQYWNYIMTRETENVGLKSAVDYNEGFEIFCNAFAQCCTTDADPSWLD